ncbi:MAG: hypothetical protein KC416_07320, partial [Myxococcales bacterium]|nr:hypothetical protein [Myxococcales bacterium]
MRKALSWFVLLFAGACTGGIPAPLFSLEISAPANGAEVMGRVEVRARSVGDTSGYQDLWLEIDGTRADGTFTESSGEWTFSDTSGEPSLDTSPLEPGPHTLAAHGLDRRGNPINSDPITIVVTVIPPLTVTIESPSANSAQESPFDVVATINADPEITSAEVFIDGQSQGDLIWNATEARWTLDPKSDQPLIDPKAFIIGPYTLEVRAQTTKDQTGSASVPFRIRNPDIPLFRIDVRDPDGGRGIPLVFLEADGLPSLVTDSAGTVVIDDTTLFGKTLEFSAHSHGYGEEKVKIELRQGDSHLIALPRVNIAKRLYRITGANIYQHTHALGAPTPIQNPLLNAGVVGQDSAVPTIYRGKLHWFWGDTELNNDGQKGYIFRASGAVSELPASGGLDPNVGVELDYFKSESTLARAVTAVDGPGLVWLSAPMVVKDASGTEQMFVGFSRLQSLSELYGRGILKWDPSENIFKPHTALDTDDDMRPVGHSTRVSDGTKEWFLLNRPFPLLRIPATEAGVTTRSEYESFTCLKPGASGEVAAPEVERDLDGHLVCGWKKNTSPQTYEVRSKLTLWKRITEEEGFLHLRNVDTGGNVRGASGTVRWNPYRGRWIMIAQQSFGDQSFLGEAWFAEADTPVGPWAYARKIITHKQY